MAGYTPQRQKETTVLEEGQKIHLQRHYICKETAFQMCLKPKTNHPTKKHHYHHHQK